MNSYGQDAPLLMSTIVTAPTAVTITSCTPLHLDGTPTSKPLHFYTALESIAPSYPVSASSLESIDPFDLAGPQAYSSALDG